MKGREPARLTKARGEGGGWGDGLRYMRLLMRCHVYSVSTILFLTQAERERCGHAFLDSSHLAAAEQRLLGLTSRAYNIIPP